MKEIFDVTGNKIVWSSRTDKETVHWSAKIMYEGQYIRLAIFVTGKEIEWAVYARENGHIEIVVDNMSFGPPPSTLEQAGSAIVAAANNYIVQKNMRQRLHGQRIVAPGHFLRHPEGI